MKSINILAGAAIAMALGMCAGAASATTVVLDNSPPGGSINPFGTPDSQTYGEVFTAPISGTLTSFTLWLNGGVGDLYGGVGDWNGSSTYGGGFGSPNNLYQSANVASTSAGPYTFSPNLNVVAGQQYVAYLSVFGDAGANTSTTMPLSGNNVSGIDYFVWNNTSDERGNPSWNYFFDAGNAQFAATFTQGVPEPATWAMMLFGVGMIGAGLRTTRRKNHVALTAA